MIQNIIDHVPKLHYLVAVDESAHTLEDFVKVQPSSRLGWHLLNPFSQAPQGGIRGAHKTGCGVGVGPKIEHPSTQAWASLVAQ